MPADEMQTVLESFTRRVGELAERQPEPLSFALELHSERELSGTDPDGFVTVTMKDFKVDSIVVNERWLENDHPSPAVVTRATIAAVNAVLQDYLVAEMTELRNQKVSLPEMYEVLQTFTTDFSAASSKAWARLEARA